MDKKVLYRGKEIPEWMLEYLPAEKCPYEDDTDAYLSRGFMLRYLNKISFTDSPTMKKSIAITKAFIADHFGDAFLNQGIRGIKRAPGFCKYPYHHLQTNDLAQYYRFLQDKLIELYEYLPKEDIAVIFAKHARVMLPKLQNMSKEREKKWMPEFIKRAEQHAQEVLESIQTPIDDFKIAKASFDAGYSYAKGWSLPKLHLLGQKSTCEMPEGKLRVTAAFRQDWYQRRSRMPLLDRGPESVDVNIDCIDFCLYLHLKGTADRNSYNLAIPEDKVSPEVIDYIREVCQKAVDEYMDSHLAKNKIGKYETTAGVNFFVDYGVRTTIGEYVTCLVDIFGRIAR